MRILCGLAGVLTVLACAAMAEATGSVQPGTLSVVAGLVGGPASCSAGPPAHGPATETCLGGPTAVATDRAGDIYVADGASNVVVKVTPVGTLSVIAGTGQRGAPTPGPATQSSLNNAYGVAVDADGNVYIDDLGNDEIEKVTPTGVLSIVAGTGRQGAPTPGPATASDLGRPVSVAASSTGNLYIADQVNHEVEEVTPDGSLSIVAGTGRSGQPIPGPARQSPLGWPTGVAVDSSGDVYIADEEASAVVEKVTPSGTLSIVAGMLHHSGEVIPGPARRSPLGGPFAVAVDQAGDLFIADPPNYCVEEVTPAGVISVIAGAGAWPLPGVDQGQLNALVYPQGVAVSPAGDLYIASTEAGIVEKVTAATDAHSHGRPRTVLGPVRVHRAKIMQTLSCVAGSGECVVTATLRAGINGRHAIVLARRRLTVGVGGFTTTTIAPSQIGKRLLSKLGTLRATLTVTADRPTLLTRPAHGFLLPTRFRRAFTLRSGRSTRRVRRYL